jgi:hypothetical protein
MRRYPSLFALVYVGVGIVIAANRHYFSHVHSLKAVVAAVLAVLLWPLLVLDLATLKRR